MKLYGFCGKGKGRKGDAVFAIVHGEQIVRQYNPSPSNPKSKKQTDSRAILKLMSQLSAVMAGDIAIQRVGMKSARNLFVKENYPLAFVSDSIANIELAKVQLTKSHVGIASFGVDRTDGQGMHISLSEDCSELLSRVVYVAFVKQPDQTLRKLDSVVATQPGDNGLFPADLKYTSNAVVVYAYGIRDLTERATVMFGNMVAPSAEEVAKLVTSRVLRASDFALTETIGCQMAVGEMSGESESVDRATVTLSSQGNGSVTGSGRYIVGSSITVRAVAGENAEFAGWYLNSASGQLVSMNANYTFTLNENITLVAKFLGTPVTVAVSSNNNAYGTVSGGGSVEAGSSITVHATPNSGYRFVNWTENGTAVSTSRDYTFTANSNRTLVANFEEVQGATIALTPNSSLILSNSGFGTFEPGTQVTLTIEFKHNVTDEDILLNGVSDKSNWTQNLYVWTKSFAANGNETYSVTGNTMD